jgi:hypothetical protein
MPAESAPGQTSPGSFDARVQGSEADKYSQGETDATGPDNVGCGRIVPSPTTRRHPVTGRFTDEHPHDIHRDVHQDLAQRQAQDAVRRMRDAHARRRSEDHRFE